MTELSGYVLHVLREGRESTLYRGRKGGDAGHSILVRSALQAHDPRGSAGRLEHEYSLAAELDAAWAVRPLALARRDGHTMLVLEDPGGHPLDEFLPRPLELARWLRIAISLASALRHAHARGLIHKDIKPANALIDAAGNVRLMGFGISSRLPRERQSPAGPEVIAGTLAYMAPEQTGRMNRSIDARSDLYSLGVTLYELLTGMLPFTASDPMEWIHCHVARKPMPPGEIVGGVPEPVAGIVLKLLAKNAEDRYQGAAGLEADLRRCQDEWEAHGRIAPFELGQHDVSERLLIPEKLYGREAEIEVLLAAFQRVVTRGRTELVLVAGEAGIGKSSIVNELHKALVPPRGIYGAGKFDQYKRNIPYATLACAFRSLVHQLLIKTDAELAQWRDALLEALGPNGALMINLIPELALIVGEQPPVPELAPQDAQNRFHFVFRRFLGVFARPEHPLALFLDDLQWLDSATLDLLERLVVEQDVRHLMLVGAYRDNEVTAEHPLLRMARAIRAAGGAVQEIRPGPLKPEAVAQMIAAAVHTDMERAQPLAELVFAKTGGNPFFTIQFLTALTEEGLLAVDPLRCEWRWDVERIRAKGITDNVAQLMAAKLRRLPGNAQQAVAQLACLGNGAESRTLALVRDESEDEIHATLWAPLRAGLILKQSGSYSFLHDRVQEAAYTLIPEGERPAAHLRLGRMLVRRTPPGEVEEHIFEIVNQLDRGAALIRSLAERVRVAELNLIAGRRAKTATAFASSLAYLAAGRAMLGDAQWETHYRLMFDLELQRAECEFVTGDFAGADNRLTALATRAVDPADLAAIAGIQVSLHAHLGASDKAVEICMGYLRRLGVEWPLHPTAEEVHEEYRRMCERLGGRAVESLFELPRMVDTRWLTIMDMMAALMMPAGIFDTNLVDLVVLRMVNISQEHGNCDASCAAYAHLSLVIGPRFGDFQAGYRFGRLGVDLVDKRDMERFRVRVYTCYGGLVIPWLRPLRESYLFSRRAFELGLESGELTWSSYAWWTRVAVMLDCGDPLDEVQREGESGLEFARKARFQLAIDLIAAPLRLAKMLRGQTRELGSFDDDEFDEARYEAAAESDPLLVHATFRYWVRKLQARFHAEDYEVALAAAAKAGALLPATAPSFENAEYHFHAGLAHAACADPARAAEHLAAMSVHHGQLRLWARDCPENFENRAALLGAEIARLEGHELQAEHLYEEGIRLSRENGFPQLEALGSELAAKFHAARGFATIADTYWRNARAGYVRWGAVAKIRQLDQRYPHLSEAPRTGTMTGTPVEQLDAGAMLSAAQALSSEIVLGRLIERLMRIVIEHAGAERGVLILLLQDGLPEVAAEAVTVRGAVEVTRCEKPVSSADLPESTLHYVIRTRDRLILDDASSNALFSRDAYVRYYHPRSVLCIPIIKQSKLMGALYLENNLTPRAFTPGRITVLEFLASQAAISLENAFLYSDLERSEAFLADGQRISHTGSWAWHLPSGRLTWSDEHYRILGCNRQDVPFPTFEMFLEKVHPEDRSFVQSALEGAVREGRTFAFDFRIMLDDGSLKYLHGVGRPVAGETGDVTEFVGSTLDVTERRQREDALRDSQAELARVSRMTTLGELTASIAHEVNQPLTAIVTQAESLLQWLAKDPPNLERVRKAAGCIIRDGHHAGDVVRGIRAMVRKAAPQVTPLDINEIIQDVIELMRGELIRHDVTLEIELADGLDPVIGDRVQLQQVLVNLGMNAIEAMCQIVERARILRLTTAPDGEGNVIIGVEDSGIGFDPRSAQRIFEPLFTTKAEGLGMGLSICRTIVEAHGGRLWACSAQPHGSLFRFTLPATSATPIDPAPRREHSAA